MNIQNSINAYNRAKKYIPGGVNSPVRAYRNVGSAPLFIDKAKGSRVYDIDGNEFIDYVGSWGPMILGHAKEEIVDAVKRAAEFSTSFGAPSLAETRLAEIICGKVKNAELVRMVNSGTEATMSAIRLARGYTGRDIIIKFEGCYHGHSDSLLIKSGSGALTFSAASSAGVPKEFAKNTVVLPYNDISALEEVFGEIGDKIAAVIVEPVAGNMGVVLPKPGFLEIIRSLTKKHGGIFIVDEVMTGFRLSPGGACERFGLDPDIITFGKIIGGGLPVGAYAGRRDIMSFISPDGPVYQAGTLSGNPLAMAAGIAQMEYLDKNPEIYDIIEKRSAKLEMGLKKASEKAGINTVINRCGSMMSVFFKKGEVYDLKSASESDTNCFAQYFKEMLNRGIYLAPSQFEAVFISAAHSDEDIERTIQAAEDVMMKLQ